MSLTKEDLLAIRGIVAEIVDEKIAPLAQDVKSIKEDVSSLKGEVKSIKEDVSSLQRGFKQFVQAQVKLVDHFDQMEGSIKLLLSHVNLSSENRDLRKTYQDIDRAIKVS